MVSPPAYTFASDFSFQLDVLRKSGASHRVDGLTLKPAQLLSDQVAADRMVETLCQETTLDRGQAEALYQSLCRDMAIAQGPPGTGKTFLGVSLARVLVASRPADSRKPILVVCMTNHALDSFLKGLREAGIRGLVRFGTQSKEDWTKPLQLSNVVKKVKKTTYEKGCSQQAQYQVEALAIEGRSWCEALNEKVLGWPAVRDYLQAHTPGILSRFTEVEKSDQSNISDIRLARKAGGFAYKYWCEGGDISDIDSLIESFSSLIGSSHPTKDFDPSYLAARGRLHRNIAWNAKDVKDASARDDIWKLSLQEREGLLEEWSRRINAQSILDRVAEVHRRHQDALTQKRSVQSNFEVRVLEDMNIIATTTTSCAMNWSKLERLGLKTLICEEAGEVMEAQSLCALFHTIEHAISIGDPLQLRPQVNEPCLSLETLNGTEYRLDESLMERLMFPATDGISPLPSSKLNIQRRMHPEIADIMRATLYPYLMDHDSTTNRERVAGIADRIFWLDHKEPEDSPDPLSPDGTSSLNLFEVEMVTGMVEYLISSNEYEYKDITILTPYNGQLAAFRERLKGVCSIWLSEKDREALIGEGLLSAEDFHDGTQTDVDISDMLRLATVDNFQGEESKIIILSVVRSNDAGRVGFMRTPNRINVACSRARNGFYIVGNASLMSVVPTWQQITNLLAFKGKMGPAFRICCPRHPEIFYHIHEPHQWHSIPPCQALCEFRFACGHQCGMRCHAPSLHERIGCTQVCERVHKECGHVCTRVCGQPCGDCNHQQPSVKLACGHIGTFTCAEAIDGMTNADVVCQRQIIIRHTECGRAQQVLCGSQGTNGPCQQSCGTILDCGHSCEGVCSDCILAGAHPTCQAKCQNMHPQCRHVCGSRCHAGSVCPPCQQSCQRHCSHGGCDKECSAVCDPCTHRCDWACDHEGRCTSLCSLPCTRLPCSKRCDKILSCGHPCPSLCGERCATVCSLCQNGTLPTKTQMYLACGHSFDIDVLDSHIGVTGLYQIDTHGNIQALAMGLESGMDSVNPQCPICTQDCAEIRRYSICKQLRDFTGVADILSALFARKTNYFLKRAYAIKLDLDATFARFHETIRPGPLTGKANETKIRERVSALDELHEHIGGFRGKNIQSLF